MRKAVLFVLAFPPVRLLLRLGGAVAGAFGRLRSLCWCAVNVPQPHRRTVRLHWSVEVKYPDRIDWGDNLTIGPECTLGAFGGISFGRDVRLSKGVVLETAGLNTAARPPLDHVGKKISIGNRVWIGAGAVVLGGVEIGDDALVGAGCVVVKNVPPATVVVGAPARTFPREPGPPQSPSASQ